MFIQLLNGLTYGSLLFLLAAGLSLMWGLMGNVNLAHGSYFMVGAYIGWSVDKLTGNFGLAILAGVVSIALIGFIMERGFLRFLYKQELEQFLLTFGFIYIFAGLGKWIWGGNVRLIHIPEVLSGSVTFMEASFPIYRLAFILIGAVVGLGLWLLQERTRIGAIIRAGVDDAEMVRGLGINIALVFTLVFTLGAALAGFGGVMGCLFVGAYPGVDMEILILALVVIVIGGMGSLRGAVAGSLLIGLADTFGKVFLPQFAMFTVFMVMALVLVFKPCGLFGRAS